MSINSRIIRSLTEDIKLIYYIKDIDYNFFVLGTSGFIYKISINKNLLSCNCEDYKDSKLCKHICFILFKVLKVFRYDKKRCEIDLIRNSSLVPSQFFKTYKLDESEYLELKNRFFKIEFMLKNSFFNNLFYTKFKNIYQKFTFFKNYIYYKSETKCAICLENNGKFIKCPNCNNEYHIDCILKWLEIVKDDMKCPICKNEIWSSIYYLILMYFNTKLDKNVII